MIALTSLIPKYTLMHLCAPIPKGIRTLRSDLCSARSSLNRSGSNFAGSVQYSGSS